MTTETGTLLPFAPTETDDMESPDRRENQWTKPPVLIAMVGLFFQATSLFILVGGGLLATYLASRSRDVSVDMTNAQVVNEVQKLSMKLDSISNLVQQANSTNTTQEGTIGTLNRDVAEIKSNLADLIKTVENNEKAQRDYNFKLGNDMAGIKAGSSR